MGQGSGRSTRSLPRPCRCATLHDDRRFAWLIGRAVAQCDLPNPWCFPMSKAIDVAVSQHSRLQFFPFQVAKEAKQYIIGRPGTGSYVEISEMGLDALNMLGGNTTVAEAKAALASRYGTNQVQLRSLIQTLLTAGFVKAVDGRAVGDVLRPRRYHFTWVTRQSIGWLFSKPAIVLYVTLIAFGAGLVLLHPGYVPGPADIFVAESYLLTTLLGVFITALNVAKHELAHLFAGKFLGIEGTISISRRLFFPVMQTDLTDLWMVDKQRRYLAYSAGMLSDLVLLSLLVTAMWVNDRGIVGFGPNIHATMNLAMLVVLFGILWQFNFFMRTDIYYILSNFFGCKNLYEDTKNYLWGGLYRKLGWHRPSVVGVVTPRELVIIRVYAAFVVIGTAILSLFTVLVLVGIAYLLFAASSQTELLLTTGRPEVGLADKIGQAGMLLLALGMLAYATLVERRRRRRIEYRLVAADEL